MKIFFYQNSFASSLAVVRFQKVPEERIVEKKTNVGERIPVPFSHGREWWVQFLDSKKETGGVHPTRDHKYE